MRENQTYDKALSYAVRIVNLYKYLVDEKKEYVMSKQLLRSGTSIGDDLLVSSIGKDRIFIWYTTWIHVI